MGMGLFYVTVFGFFFRGGFAAGIGGFAGVFEGGREKRGCFVVVFLW
jgi:hypothetical protein